MQRFVSSQPQYSLLWRGPEHEIFELCARNGIGQIVWSPLAQGILTGKYRPGQAPPADSRAASREMGGFMKGRLRDDVAAAVQRLLPGGRRGRPLAVAPRPGLGAAPDRGRLGDRRRFRPEQVFDNARAAGITLSADTLAAIDEALGDVVVRDFELAAGARAGVRHR